MATNSPVAGPQYNDGVPTGEAEQVQYAVELSLQDQQTEQNAVRSSNREAIRHTDELILSLNNQFANLDDPLGDTAIWIGPPPKMPENSVKEYAQIQKHFDRIYIVQSANLMLMGEGSKFTKMLGPMSVRAERKIRKTGLLTMPEARRGGKFKYYINLRPPTEDDEAVILITDLTCTKGVLTWHLARQKYDLSPLTVLGHDGFDTVPQPVPTPPEKTGNTASSNVGARVEGGAPGSARSQHQRTSDPTSTSTADPDRIASEYTPLRHWSAIERVLHAIQGNDPKLDSAPKVWTFFAVARYLGCTHHERVSGWITTWIYSENNANFIQCNPEVAYEIGMGIESAELVRDAFSILVGERALLEAYGEYNPKILNPLLSTVHGRKVESLDDDERNRIDHAASSLVRRQRQLVSMLCRDMSWLQESTEYQKLAKLVGRTQLETDTINAAKEEVREYIRSRIYYVLCQDQFVITELEKNAASTASFRAGTSEKFAATYNLLNQPMRMFTRTFWTALSLTRFDKGMYSTSAEGTIGDSTSTRYHEALMALYDEDPMNGIKRIPRASLDFKISAVNNILIAHQNVKAFGVDPLRQAELNQAKFNHITPQDITNESQSSLPQSPNTLNPEAINFSSLAIGGNSKHASDEAGPSIQDQASPSKRRKTLDGDDVSQAVPVSSSWRTPLESSTDEVFPGKGKGKIKANVLYQTTSDDGATGESRTHALPIRQRRSSVVNVEHDRVWRQLGSSRADDYTDHTTNGNDDSSKSTNEAYESTLASTGTGLSTSSGVRFGDKNDLIPPRAFDLDADNPQTPIIGHVREDTNNNTFDYMYNSFQEPGFTIYTRVSSGLLLDSVNTLISKICMSILHPPHLFHSTGLLPTNLIDCLMCLDEDEFKYLPLWAGGNDDGTGGVYDDMPVPNLDAASQSVESFAPGRIHKAYDAPSDSDMGTTSAFDYIGSSQAMSTVGKASKRATDGTQTIVSLHSASEAASETTSVVHVTATATVVDMSDDDSFHYMSSMANTPNDTDDDDADTDMAVEAHDRSDDEFEDEDYDDNNDDSDNDNDFSDDALHDDNHDILTGENDLSDDETFTTALSEPATVRSHKADAASEQIIFHKLSEQHGVELEEELAIVDGPGGGDGKGKGKEKEILPVEVDKGLSLRFRSNAQAKKDESDDDDDFELV